MFKVRAQGQCSRSGLKVKVQGQISKSKTLEVNI